MKKNLYIIIGWLMNNNNLKFKELFLLSGLYSILLLAPTLFSLKMLDQIILDKNLNGFIYLFLITTSILIVSSIIDFYRHKIINDNISGIYLDLIDKNYNSLLESNIEFEKINKIKVSVQNSIIEVLIDLPWAILYLLAFFLLHPILGLSAFILLVAQFFFLLKNIQINKELELEEHENIGKLSSRFQEFNIIGMGNYLINFIKETQEKLSNQKNYNEECVFLLEQKIKFYKTFFQLIIISVGAILYINKEISLGSIIAISLLVSKILSPLSFLYSNWFKLLEISYLIELLSNKESSRKITNIKDKIKIIFKEDEIFLNEGDILIIKGANGSGKTTMIKNILNDIQKTNYNVGYLSQKTIFISGSIEEVISGFAEKESKFDEKIKKSITLSGTDLVVQKFKNNIKEKLEREKMSMGELQKILLAKAFFDSPKFIVLDEPENHLDYSSLDVITESIKELSGEGSIFIIATKNNQIENIGNKNIAL